jgi:hypothetical protein
MLEKLAALQKSLEGKKSYVMATIAGLAILANHMGWITEDQLKTILELSGFGYSLAMASKVNRALGVKNTDGGNNG